MSCPLSGVVFPSLPLFPFFLLPSVSWKMPGLFQSGWPGLTSHVRHHFSFRIFAVVMTSSRRPMACSICNILILFLLFYFYSCFCHASPDFPVPFGSLLLPFFSSLPVFVHVKYLVGGWSKVSFRDGVCQVYFSLSASVLRREAGGSLMSPPCLESQGFQFDPAFLYLLSCSSA